MVLLTDSPRGATLRFVHPAVFLKETNTFRCAHLIFSFRCFSAAPTIPPPRKSLLPLENCRTCTNHSSPTSCHFGVKLSDLIYRGWDEVRANTSG